MLIVDEYVVFRFLQVRESSVRGYQSHGPQASSGAAYAWCAFNPKRQFQVICSLVQRFGHPSYLVQHHLRWSTGGLQKLETKNEI